MANGGVLRNGAWRDDADDGSDAGNIPTGAVSTIQSSSVYDYTPVVVFGWQSDTTLYLKVPANETNDWTNAEARGLFQSMLVNFATAYKPPFVFLGNENDAYYEHNPTGYANWISFYHEAYDAIKAVLAKISVEPVFNFEHLAGWGELNGWIEIYWEALEAHDSAKIDVVGVTVYPWLNYATAFITKSPKAWSFCAPRPGDSSRGVCYHI